ncbi:unnamed protein product [Closterium sp. Yama58-4]|nr:unnamed protein product [Closterium sp. Yama58-4]
MYTVMSITIIRNTNQNGPLVESANRSSLTYYRIFCPPRDLFAAPRSPSPWRHWTRFSVTPLTQEEKDELEVAKTPGLLAPISISPDNPEEFENLGSMRTRYSPALIYNLLRNFEDAPRVYKNIAHCDVDPLEEPGTFRVTQHIKWRFLFLSGTFATTLICQRDDAARSVNFKLAEPGFMKAFKGGWTIHDLSPPKPLPLASPSTPPSMVALKASFFKSLAAALPVAAATAAEAEAPPGAAEGAASGISPSGSLIEMWQLSQPAMVPPRPLLPYVYGIMSTSMRAIFQDLCVEADRVERLEKEASAKAPQADVLVST